MLGDLKMERIHRYSAAINRNFSAKLRGSLTFSAARYGNQLRGVNLNAPVDGVRPDTSFANVIEVVADASAHTYDLVSDVNLNFAGGIRNSAAARWLDDQWGSAGGDTRHRLRASVSTQAVRNLNAQLSWDANSGAPYTITTGTDDNGDSIFNDRPVLTPRNSARLPWRSTLSANLSYTVPIGRAPGPEGGRAAAGGRPGGGRGGRQKGITINVSAQNLTNRSNFSGFSGVMTSQYFMQATSVSNPRQVDLSIRVSFYYGTSIRRSPVRMSSSSSASSADAIGPGLPLPMV